MGEAGLSPLQWALPEDLEVPKDQFRMRLDFYNESIVMHAIDGGVITNRLVSAVDIASAMSREITFFSSLLPPNALWWSHSRQGDQLALWRRPQMTLVSIQTQAFQPPERYRIPLPGLVFVCQSGRSPAVYAARSRPQRPEDKLYHCPTFNVFHSGNVCPGTHHFPEDVTEIPASFFQSLFSMTGDSHERSRKYPANLLRLWKEELVGRRTYPLGDLVEWGRVSSLFQNLSTLRR
jgi:PRTRC genetic system protein B